MPASCLISIIIPVHNNTETLANCLDSIISQDFESLEIILVNNGSTDESAGLCDSYREKDRRVQVVHMEQSGREAALNSGIRAASGDYIHFVEPDDTINEKAFDNLVEVLNTKADVIFLASSLSQPVRLWDVSHNNIMRRLSQNLPERIWDKLISREFLIREDLRFTDGTIWEEVDFNIKLYIHAKKYAAADFLYYIHEPKGEKEDTGELFSRVILTLSKWAGPAESTYEEYSQHIHRWMAAMYSDFLIPMYGRLPREAQKIYKPGMSDFKWLLDVRKSRKDDLVKILYTFLGLLPASCIIMLSEIPSKGLSLRPLAELVNGIKWKDAVNRLKNIGGFCHSTVLSFIPRRAGDSAELIEVSEDFEKEKEDKAC